MSTRDIEGEWRAASYFLAKGPSATLQYLQKDVRSNLFALKAQALDGDCPPGQDGSMAMDPSLRIRQEAWNALKGMSREQAKRNFVDLLTEVLPEWKKWSADYASKTNSGEEHESEADKLVKAFKLRMGISSSTSIQLSRL
ncbi:acyl-CoA-binding domain-containing protein 1 isoform X4 [Physcomitrium patens]|nr:acyl-CoA-binding domain-containing protein 1-like isoform X4 [Physcomitrium patens]XP_024400906.1 acyl-CoA-binding domain-containing protein 1-like isoform X4 [Physcomitrium patens]XP_024400907.1 acyl-CoA-binding domain-containing protein 1-like isoform X4 [Physcomitrium patens]XP_024400908.1 acyl-CoA-binding domain-containing protein 1-like isoform X4 [Physcomitrium patens]XP_024400909.1 acyl-CoA-binding domain-containing protein 1-like isoform X4 [Physcomitrium patens]XP_024400910.1 acyl-|eukprot:XP_024400904.1 acyl-CoA-binding domain-containing protein 1-like isoform X4 [Physcomitrella patens]